MCQISNSRLFVYIPGFRTFGSFFTSLTLFPLTSVNIVRKLVASFHFSFSPIMLDELEFAIHFKRISLHNALNYIVTHIKYDWEGNLFMTLIDGDLVNLYAGDAKLFEFTNLVHSKNFTTPIFHGIRGIINFHKLKLKLK